MPPTLDTHRDDRSPRWIYPDLFNLCTSCRELVPIVSWKRKTTSGRAVTRP